jgi:uncharacterized protein YwqG
MIGFKGRFGERKNRADDVKNLAIVIYQWKIEQTIIMINKCNIIFVYINRALIQ